MEAASRCCARDIGHVPMAPAVGMFVDAGPEGPNFPPSRISEAKAAVELPGTPGRPLSPPGGGRVMGSDRRPARFVSSGNPAANRSNRARIFYPGTGARWDDPDDV